MLPFFAFDFQAQLRDRESRLQACVDWDRQNEMNLRAASYSCRNLFPEVTPREEGKVNCNEAKPGEYVDSPCGGWRYIVNTLPKGSKLRTWSGSKIGSVLFDGPVCIPTIYSNRLGNFRNEPWMSLTPAEVMSMRTGARLAMKHTVVVGLGLGHLLIEVAQKRSVKKITLVEIDRGLVDWLLPKIKPYLTKEIEVIVGDAHSVMPSLEADVALIDIYPGYGDGPVPPSEGHGSGAHHRCRAGGVMDRCRMLERITESAWVCLSCRLTIKQPLAEALQGIIPEHNCEETRAKRRATAEAQKGQRYADKPDELL